MNDPCSNSKACAAPSTAWRCCAASTSRSRRGGITGLIGPNGAGKTTLFNVVSGLVPPDAGSIRFDGQEIAGQVARCGEPRRAGAHLPGGARLSQALGVPASHALWPRPAGRERCGRRSSARARRASARRSWRSGRWETARFLRLDRLIDNPATALSGGQKKLLEIGRALMAEPRLVLLDEPTAGVNPTLQNEIGERLLELPRRGITVLLIEHDMGFIARLCDPVIVMAEGQVLTQGTFDDVRNDARVREAYLGTAARHEPARRHRPARRLWRGRRDREGRGAARRAGRDRRADRPERRRQVDLAEADRRACCGRAPAISCWTDRDIAGLGAPRRSAGSASPSCRRSATSSAR